MYLHFQAAGAAVVGEGAAAAALRRALAAAPRHFRGGDLPEWQRRTIKPGGRSKKKRKEKKNPTRSRRPKKKKAKPGKTARGKRLEHGRPPCFCFFLELTWKDSEVRSISSRLSGQTTNSSWRPFCATPTHTHTQTQTHRDTPETPERDQAPQKKKKKKRKNKSRALGGKESDPREEKDEATAFQGWSGAGRTSLRLKTESPPRP